MISGSALEEIGNVPVDGPGSTSWIEVRAPGGAVDPVLYTTHFDPDQVGRLEAVLLHLRLHQRDPTMC